MTTQTVTPPRSPVTPQRDSFWYLVHAEWTKFRTVRGWVIAVLATIAAITAFVFLGADVSGGCGVANGAGGASAAACPAQPTGPGGVPVIDAFYFAHQPVAGNGTITVQVTSLTAQGTNGSNQLVPGGLAPWSKAGIIIKENTSPGSAYAAKICQRHGNPHHQIRHVAAALPACYGGRFLSLGRGLRAGRVRRRLSRPRQHPPAEGPEWHARMGPGRT